MDYNPCKVWGILLILRLLDLDRVARVIQEMKTSLSANVKKLLKICKPINRHEICNIKILIMMQFKLIKSYTKMDPQTCFMESLIVFRTWEKNQSRSQWTKVTSTTTKGYPVKDNMMISSSNLSSSWWMVKAWFSMNQACSLVALDNRKRHSRWCRVTPAHTTITEAALTFRRNQR